VLTGKNGVSVEHLLIFLRQTNIQPFVTGAVQPKLNQANLCKIPFVMPPLSICKKFETLIELLYKILRVNIEHSRVLSTIRDSMLPKLMSGKIRAKKAYDAIEVHK
jgi:type I restriction enzyme S subunit